MNVLGCKNRKANALYVKTCSQIERLSKFIFMGMMKVALQCSILPKCIVSFGVYFFTDSGGDSFALPYPMW